MATKLITVEMTGDVNFDPFVSKKNRFHRVTKERYINYFDRVDHTTLTKNTNYLLTDDLNSNTTKMQKAKKLGIPIVTYADFAINYQTILQLSIL